MDKVFGKKNKYEVKEEDVKAGLDAMNELIDMYNEALDNSRRGDQIKIGKELAKLYRDIGAEKEACQLYRDLAMAYQNLGEPNKAIEYHEKILEIAKDTGDKGLESACYFNISLVYEECLDDFKKAEEYQEKALKIAKNIK